jgi:signal recognition particle subunit SRP9
MKYRHCDGKLVLKVTDDQTVRTSLSIHSSPGSNPSLPQQCLKYKASHAQVLKKIEKLNNLFLRSATEKLNK